MQQHRVVGCLLPAAVRCVTGILVRAEQDCLEPVDGVLEQPFLCAVHRPVVHDQQRRRAGAGLEVGRDRLLREREAVVADHHRVDVHTSAFAASYARM